ncbi:hypothetical protein D5H78_13005 [Vallicoccus soli]|uniref:Uncharacterized protein n=1 Tax=Vallicoccus soli TaxID=2339232 RepID=A0A3A3Z2S7_9ACTN|nr:hypothetical protein D5H78_13005 [Vallicoccus soli]
MTRLDERELRELIDRRDVLHALEPQRLHLRWWRPCSVRVLLVTDGGLDFGSGDFGLRTFVTTLLSGTYPAHFRITLAHRRSRGGDAMMEDDGRVERRISGFRFDDRGHFAADQYDQLWMFGIESAPGITDREVRAVAEFMDAGGGVFATGDHAALGRAMGERIPRVRSMRLWDSTPGVDEVSMGGHRRNDTNRRGHDAASTFDDQSDDVPQVITPRWYRTRVGLFEAVYPHPLLCGPDGAITVMPDHPHEGECHEPADTSQVVDVGGASFVEYPPAVGGGPKPVPEVIATSTVLGGTKSGTKDATQGHTFGGIAAYDGHLAGVGRVVTDATWHHFVNINLIGAAGAAPPKDSGFLATPAGASHLARVRTYYRNTATWISPPGLLRCMNRRLLWDLVWHHRVVEAVATTAEVDLRRAHPVLLWHIGKQARDVLGRRTSACQSVRLVLDLVWQEALPELFPEVDPWLPRDLESRPAPQQVPWFDPSPVLDLALGSAVTAVHQAFAEDEQVDQDSLDERLDEVLARGVAVGLERARESAREALEQLDALVQRVTTR